MTPSQHYNEAELLAEASQLDPLIRQRVITLANMALDHAEHLIKFGDPNMKARLISSFLTSLSRHMKVREHNDELDTLRTELESLKQAVMSRMPGESNLQVIDGGLTTDATVDRPIPITPLTPPRRKF